MMLIKNNSPGDIISDAETRITSPANSNRLILHVQHLPLPRVLHVPYLPLPPVLHLQYFLYLVSCMFSTFLYLVSCMFSTFLSLVSCMFRSFFILDIFSLRIFTHLIIKILPSVCSDLLNLTQPPLYLLNKALMKTLDNVNEKFHGIFSPTILWSGRKY